MTHDKTQLSPNKQALLRIRELKEQLAKAQQWTGEPIAVVSMACRFPQRASTPELFWDTLIEQRDESGEVPDGRWDLEAFFDEDPEVAGKMYARRGCFLEQIDQMDPEFFGISPREATWVDPQQRLLMEVGWEAIERAGWIPEKIGEQTGVFIGWMHNDYQNEASDSFLNLNPYIATGAAGSFLCGRLAYYLGLQGPSVAVDTACSSSLVALHLAIQSLQQRDCDRALVGGVNVICSPTTNILTCKLKALSPHGHSRAFDAKADGYLRGEGCGVITIRRLSDAQKDNDPILAVIRGSAIGHNGFSSGLTAPNPKAQERVIRQALDRAKIKADEVAYLEAHGTGTELGDPIEMQAAAAALSGSRTAQNPLLVGSVKTNIGHLEAAAGMAGLMKVLLAMHHNLIPSQLHFDEPNPHIPWDRLPVKVLSESSQWPNSERKIAGVSAFGMSGTNAHVIVEAPEAIGSATVSVDPGHPDQRPVIVSLSAQHGDALYELASDYSKAMQTNEEWNLSDVSFTTNVGRSHFEHRAAIVSRSRDELVTQLKQLARADANERVFVNQHRRAPRIAWQFTGQGSQYVGMAKGLYDSFDEFRRAIDECDHQLLEFRGESLLPILFSDAEALNDTRWTQPAIFAVQKGLVRLFEQFGISPTVVMGHSVGQYAAACTAGIMSWEDGLRLISERGRLIAEKAEQGSMLAVMAPLEQVEAFIDGHAQLSLAAANGTHNVVSGPSEEVESLATSLKDRGVRAKILATSHAFHSAMMDPVLEGFAAIAQTIEFQSPKIPLICNVSGEVIAADQRLDGDYWAAHIRQAVRYSKSLQALNELSCDLLVELGPQSVLTNMAASGWSGAAGDLISTLTRGEDDATSFTSTIAKLFVRGANPELGQFHDAASRKIVSLPTYPFQRRRFWGPDKPKAAHAEKHTAHPLLGGKISLAGSENESRFESFIEQDSPAWLPDHEVMGNVTVPGAALIEMAIAAANGKAICEVQFEQPLQPKSRTQVQTLVKKQEDGSQSIGIYSASRGGDEWKRHFSARIEASNHAPDAIDRSALEATCPESTTSADFYGRLKNMGLNYGPSFQTVRSLSFSDSEVICQLQVQGSIRGYSLAPTLLDGAFHALAIGVFRDNDDSIFLPSGAERVEYHATVDGDGESEVWCHAKWTENTGKTRSADLVLFRTDGEVVATVKNFQVQQINLAAFRQMTGVGSERLVHELNWQAERLPASSLQPTRWIAINHQDDAAQETSAQVDQLAERILNAGHQVDRYPIGSEPVLQADWDKLFAQESDEAAASPGGIVWFLPEQNQGESSKSVCVSLINLVKSMLARGQRQLKCGILFVTKQAIAIEADEAVSPDQTQYWGLLRVLSAEQPELRCRVVDVSSQAEASDELLQLLLTETRDNQFAIRDSQFFVPRMKVAKPKGRPKTAFAAKEDRCYLITGGLGKLGLQAAAWLASRGARQLVLVSRRSPDEAVQAFIDSIDSQVVVHQADMSSAADVENLFQRFGKDLAPLGGVIHAAGRLHDAFMESQTWEQFESVLAPKITAASLLHEHTKSLDLDLFVLYSSAASVLGSPGQSNYAMGNAYLDGLAWQRRSLGLPAVSLNWGPWSEGMADDERIVKHLARQGITPLSVDEAHAAMEIALSGELVQATVMDVDWRRMTIGAAGHSPAILDNLIDSSRKKQAGDSALVAKLKQLDTNARRDSLLSTIQNSLQDILSTPDAPETDRPLIEMGLDSLMAVEFGTELQQMLGDEFAVGPTMLFDHPTIDAITDHVLELIEAATPTSTSNETKVDVVSNESEPVATAREDIAIIGVSCRFPGADDITQFWENLLNGVDSVREIPDDRWDVDEYFSEDRAAGKMYSREGGFLDRIADFDADFFNISGEEACWIDPQHRMLLEQSYLALEDAGVSTQPLVDPNVGVFMGIMGQDYAFLPTLDDKEVFQGFQGAGLSHSAGVGRISFVFGFEGPSIAVDTASSSSLVALIQAVRSLQDSNCNVALAGGVNAILAPVNSILMSKAGLLAPDGRCKSFSAEANGFGRGEGCGVVVLKRLSDAQRDRDRILAVIRGGAIVHNGTSSGITSPSGKAQARVIDAALKDSGIAPSQVQYLEAHGTGTEFGDPMELSAASSVLAKGRSPSNPLLCGSVKANISHLEAAGGVSGLIKTVLAIHHGLIPKQIHFEHPSPHLPWNRMPVKMVEENTTWPESDQRVAGITALGLVGTNAHVVLSSCEEVSDPRDSEQPERPEHLLVISARNQKSLNRLVHRYLNLLQSDAELDLHDVCFSAGTGRRFFEHRLAIPFQSRQEAVDRLSEALSLDPVGSAVSGGASKLGWLFPSTIDESARLLGDLIHDEPIIAELIQTMDRRLGEHLQKTGQDEFSISQVAEEARTVSAPESENGSNQQHTEADFDLLLTYSLQVSLATLWQAWGIESDAVLGIGVGQLAAYHVSGGIQVNDGTILAYEWDRYLSNPSEDALDAFESLADQVTFYPPNMPMVCSESGDVIPVHKSLGGNFWRNFIEAESKLDQAIETFLKLDCATIMQIGSESPELRAAVDSQLTNLNQGSSVEYVRLPGTSQSEHGVPELGLMNALGKLFQRGATPCFRGLYQAWPRRRVSLPGYQFNKQRYWITEIGQHLKNREQMDQVR